MCRLLRLPITVECSSSRGLRAMSFDFTTKALAEKSPQFTTKTPIAATLCSSETFSKAKGSFEVTKVLINL